MALENGTYINSLNASNPTITDQIDQGDDHIRLIKSTIKNTFPSVTGAVTLTHTQINDLPGDLTALETTVNTTITNSLALKANINSPTLTGTPTSTTPAAADNSTKIATTAFVQGEITQSLSDFQTGTSNIGNNSVALGTKTTGNYAASVHGDTSNSAGIASITVDGTAGEGTDFGLELSYKLVAESTVSNGVAASSFDGKKFLFVY